MDTPSYKYSPLVGDELRFIALQPGEFADQICLAIFHASLAKAVESQHDKRLIRAQIIESVQEPWEVYETPEGRYFFYLDAPDVEDSIGPTFEYPGPELTPESYAPKKWGHEGIQYEALSYVWGNKPSATLMQVVNENASQTLGSLPVLKNLETALRHLRLKDKPRTLWIDAISINQSDLEERSQQVQRMGLIYSQASRVVVWLGPSDKDTQLAMQLLEYYGKQVMIATDYTVFRMPDSENEDWWRDDILPPYDEKEWSAITHLIERPWFERVWTMQEITLANPEAIMISGKYTVKYYHLRRAFFSLALKIKQHPIIERLGGRQFIDCGKTDRFFIHLMHLMTKAKCFDPRDKVYGALHIMGPKLRDRIVPSYALPFEEVYKSTFLAYTETTGRLDLLCQRPRTTEPFAGPTWVPDFRQIPEAKDPLSSNFLAAGMTKADILYDGGSVLKVTGLQHDKISVVHPNLGGSSDITTKLKQISPTHLQLSATYPNGEDSFRAWTRTICLDNLFDRMNDQGSYQKVYTSDLLAVLARLLENNEEEGLEKLQELSCYEDIVECLKEWSFIQTENGFFGFTHSDALPGDSVCVLLGCWAPIVLRPQATGSWKVIGDSYLHGIMDSETLLGPLPPEFTAQFLTRNGASHPFYVVTKPDENGALMKYVHEDDPRIGDLPEEWKPNDIGNLYRDADDPVFYMQFYNSETGTAQNSDPRLTPEKLRARGVPLRTFDLV